MTSCSRSDKVLAYLTGMLKPEERADFEEHLAGCRLCQRELELERAISGRLADGAEAPARLRLQVRKRLLLAYKPTFPWKSLAGIAGMVAAVALLVTSLARLLPPSTDRQLEAMLRIVQRNFASLASTGILGSWLLVGIALAGLATLIARVIPED
ncbi:hypothetical protein GF402_07625 [Candidatus Fermentibacteria bacterium]|nr:hypothetical protein [Candidatus Fermentibacteria bacterium]